MSKRLHKAVSQLKDYYEAFNVDKTKAIFKEKYKTDVFKPDLQLLFGRSSDIVNNKALQEYQRRENVQIKDWDTFLKELKRRFR